MVRRVRLRQCLRDALPSRVTVTSSSLSPYQRNLRKFAAGRVSLDRKTLQPTYCNPVPCGTAALRDFLGCRSALGEGLFAFRVPAGDEYH